MGFVDFKIVSLTFAVWDFKPRYEDELEFYGLLETFKQFLYLLQSHYMDKFSRSKFVKLCADGTFTP